MYFLLKPSLTPEKYAKKHTVSFTSFEQILKVIPVAIPEVSVPAFCALQLPSSFGFSAVLP